MLTPEQLQTINGIDLALWATGFLMGYGFRKLVTWANAQERALRQDLRFYRKKGRRPGITAKLPEGPNWATKNGRGEFIVDPADFREAKAERWPSVKDT